MSVSFVLAEVVTSEYLARLVDTEAKYMERNEINIVIALNSDNTEFVAAFTDRETALEYFKKLRNKGIAVAIHSVELNSGKELLQEFDI